MIKIDVFLKQRNGDFRIICPDMVHNSFMLLGGIMKTTTETPRSIIQELVEQVEDFIINYQCSCVGTKHCPCPRCKVTIEQGQELLDRLKGEVKS